MSLLLYKRLKSFFISLAFILAGFTLLYEPHEPVAAYISRAFPLVGFALAFMLCGIINFVIVIRNRPANMLWYAPYYAFWTASVLVWLADHDSNPTISIVLSTLLGVLLTVDVIQDMRGDNG